MNMQNIFFSVAIVKIRFGMIGYFFHEIMFVIIYPHFVKSTVRLKFNIGCA